VRTESEIFCTVHQKDRGFRSFGLVSVKFFFVAFWFSFHQVRQLALISLSSGVSEAILRFNCSLLMLILVCISVLLAAFPIPIVVRIFSLSIPNLLKLSRSNSVGNVFVFLHIISSFMFILFA